MEKVSVAICTYNGEKYIGAQLESILKQSRAVDEIVICDDCSSDSTLEVVKESLESFNGECRIVKNTKSMGVADNFAQAYDLCKGDIIISCDQDDVWKEDKVTKTLEAMNKETVFVFSDADVVDSLLNPIGTLWENVGLNYEQVQDTEKFSKRILKAFCVTGATMAFRKSLWKSVKPIGKPCLHDIWLSVLAPVYGGVKAIPEKLILYRRHAENVTRVGHKNDYKSKAEKRYANHFITEYNELSSIVNVTHSDTDNKYELQINDAYKYHSSTRYIIDNHNRLFKILKLLKEFILGRFKIFRGGWKVFASDLLFIVFNKNDDIF